MKKLIFKHQLSYIKGKKEDPRDKNTNWERIIYIAVLIIILVSLLVYMGRRFLFVMAQGQVLTEKLVVAFPYDVRIMKLKVREFDEVKPGDTLFTTLAERNIGAGNGMGLGRDSTNSGSLSNGRDNYIWVTHEIMTVTSKIKVLEIESAGLTAQLNQARQEEKRVNQEVRIGVYTANKYYEWDNIVRNTETNLVKGQEEIKYLKAYLASLIEQKSALDKALTDLKNNARLGASGNGNLIPEQFIAPMSGQVTNIYKNENEVALQGEPVMNVASPGGAFIKCFFQQNDLSNFHEKDQVDIIFPDGSNSAGYIQKIYFSTNPLPVELRDHFQTPERTIAADIRPINKIEGDKWKIYYKLTVNIRKAKNFWPFK